jgi:hypothetical protein
VVWGEESRTAKAMFPTPNTVARPTVSNATATIFRHHPCVPKMPPTVPRNSRLPASCALTNLEATNSDAVKGAVQTSATFHQHNIQVVPRYSKLNSTVPSAPRSIITRSPAATHLV